MWDLVTYYQAIRDDLYQTTQLRIPEAGIGHVIVGLFNNNPVGTSVSRNLQRLWTMNGKGCERNQFVEYFNVHSPSIW
jgi:hypothetical protein